VKCARAKNLLLSLGRGPGGAGEAAQTQELSRQKY
jgi:hypothetical protein